MGASGALVGYSACRHKKPNGLGWVCCCSNGRMGFMDIDEALNDPGLKAARAKDNQFILPVARPACFHNPLRDRSAGNAEVGGANSPAITPITDNTKQSINERARRLGPDWNPDARDLAWVANYRDWDDVFRDVWGFFRKPLHLLKRWLG